MVSLRTAMVAARITAGTALVLEGVHAANAIYDGVGGGGSGSNIPEVDLSSFPDEEREAIEKTLEHIDNGTVPTDQTKVKWGDTWWNNNGQLPGNAGEGGYREYRVTPRNGDYSHGNNVRRILVGDDGRVYYSNTHYGDIGTPDFVRIR